MPSDEERRKILEMIEQGLISAEDGINLLNAMTDDLDSPAGSLLEPVSADVVDAPEGDRDVSPRFPTEDQEAAEPAPEPTAFDAEPEVIQPAPPFDPKKLKWDNFWMIPLWVGVGITLIGALLMFAAWNAGGLGFWFACTWFPFMFGVAVVALAWASRSARWLHVRVYQKPGEKPERIAISLPIPLRLTAWFFRTFGHKIPHLGDTSLDEVIIALENTSPDAPFFVEVNEGEDGERVEVYIG